jgi:hypothetical protein
VNDRGTSRTSPVRQKIGLEAEEEILEFGRAFDPQPFQMDPEGG